MRAAFIVPARDKAAHVENCVRSVLAQTLPGLEIILSDQGSTDGTRAAMASLVADYDGPHEVRLVDCPATEYRGMAGLNAHLAWLHEQTDAEIVLMSAADDIAHPERAEKVLRAFEETGASFVGTCMEFMRPDGEVTGYTAHPEETGWVTARQHLFDKVGGSSSTAWRRSLVDKYRPFEGIACSDLTLPYYGSLEGGFWYIREPLHAYICHADANNTGLEGVIRAAEGDDDRVLQLHELGHYHIATTYNTMLNRLNEVGGDYRDDDVGALIEKLLETACAWAATRDVATLRRLPPLPFKV